MARVYISQPMSGTLEEIKAVREAVAKDIKDRNLITESFTLIDNVNLEGAPKDANDLWVLGKSIELMYNADYVYFVRGWARDPRCRIEHQLAMQREYEKQILQYQN